MAAIGFKVEKFAKKKSFSVSRLVVSELVDVKITRLPRGVPSIIKPSRKGPLAEARDVSSIFFVP